ncbi:MAG: hypothetical protein RMK02_03130 [Burkholderiales bacterium]|nr:hypothetical protein [Burkholderiales bacterium]
MNRSANASPPTPPQVTALPKLTLWDAETLRRELLASDPNARLRALAMCVQPGAPVAQVLDALAHASAQTRLEYARLAAPTPIDRVPLQLAAAALGQVAPQQAGAAVEAELCALLALDCPVTATHAAHALWRLERLPEASLDPLARWLVHEDANVRAAAALAAERDPRRLADALVRTVHATPRERWSIELLDTLARSAGEESAKRRAVESFLTEAATSVPLVPVGMGILTALVRLEPSRSRLQALAQLAGHADETVALTALASLARLGKLAQALRSELLALLARTDDPAREEALCRLLVGLDPRGTELPLERMMQRIASGPERAVAAHCLLAAAQAEAARPLAALIEQRFATGTPALRPVLSATHEQLVGRPLEALQQPAQA